MSLLANSNAIEDAGYKIQRSLRFRSAASAYFNRTPASTGNRQVMTFSFWMKRGLLTYSSNYLMLFNAYPGSSAVDIIAFSPSSDSLRVWFNGSASADLITTQVFRDPSAWYHVVVAIDTTQATASNRIKMYVNGSQITSFSTATYPTQNYSTYWNSSSYVSAIGANLNGPQAYFDGYLAEVNFIDGQALTPSSFGQTDAVTGVWQPKKYAGTYGTNGFYLPFSDNTSATTLAYDKSGNSNNWTPNNISTTAGATYDSMTDVPTLTSATAANYCTWNPLNFTTGFGIADGNLNANIPNIRGVSATIGMASGKWYAETTLSQTGVLGITLATYSNSAASATPFEVTGGYGYITTGNKRNAGMDSAYGASYTSTDIIGIAFDADAGTLTFYKNGTSQGTAFTGIPANTYVFAAYGASGTTNPTNAVLNCGQRPFSYTPPTGFKALNAFNLPDPTIKKPNQYMDASLYNGTGSNQTITNTAGFQPDLVWLKKRGGSSGTAQWHMLADSVRGTGDTLSSNQTDAEYTGKTSVTAFNSNGFNLGADLTTNPYYGWNINTDYYVGWQWKKGATPGFDIVTYDGNGANRTVSHSLGVAPKTIIVKARAAANGVNRSWCVWHTALSSTEVIFLDQTAAKSTGATTYWNSTLPTASVFSLGTENNVNNSTGGVTPYVAYLFAEIAGFSKFGSYTGNGSADGPFVYCGFRPKYVMAKRSDSGAYDWFEFDSARETYNVMFSHLKPNTSGAEDTGVKPFIDFTSNGFKLRTSNNMANASGGTYIFACFAENPFKYSLAR